VDWKAAGIFGIAAQFAFLVGRASTLHSATEDGSSHDELLLHMQQKFVPVETVTRIDGIPTPRFGWIV